MTFEEGKLIIAYQNLDTIPEDFVNCVQEGVFTLDLSHNKIRTLEFLGNFKNVTAVILDHNCIDASVEFPLMPNVNILWLNFNCIDQLFPFVRNIRKCFPSLKHLSLMGNEIVPPCREDTYYEYIQYRLLVISWLQNLEYLDDRSVTQDEREEALRLYKRPLLERMQSASFLKFFSNTFTSIRHLVEGNDSSAQPSRYHSCVI